MTFTDAQEKLIRSIPLEGRSVLDVGGYDGKHARLALDLGAADATVLDSGEWRLEYAWPSFEVPPGVEYVDGRLEDDEFLSWRQRDVVIFFNVLYHLEDPIGGLKRLRRITRERMLLCTSFVLGPTNYWRLYSEHDIGERMPKGATRYTNWFKPTASGLRLALERTGWKIESDPLIHNDHVLMVCA